MSLLNDNVNENRMEFRFRTLEGVHEQTYAGTRNKYSFDWPESHHTYNFDKQVTGSNF